jgi:hypothetical protein
MVFGCSGCSYIFVTGKPANAESLPPSEPVECSTSKAAPVLDTVFGSLEIARTAYALSRSDGDYSGQPLSRGADIGFGVGFVALFASSAIYGYLKTSPCADAKAQHERARQQYLEPEPPAPPGPMKPLAPAVRVSPLQSAAPAPSAEPAAPPAPPAAAFPAARTDAPAPSAPKPGQ